MTMTSGAGYSPDVDITPDGVEIDPEVWSARAVYHLLNALVVPRPIAWVSTVDEQGRANVAPHSYFTIVSTDPAVVAFTSLGRKDTLVNLEAVGEFVVNVAARDQLEAMNVTSAAMPHGEDEFEWAGLEKVASHTVRPPGVAGAPARLECRVDQVIERGNGHLVLGQVTRVHVADDIWTGSRVDVAAMDPICRLAGSDYAVLGERINRPRPAWEDLSRPS